MDRKDFLKTLITAGLCCCGTASTLSAQSLNGKKLSGNSGDESARWIEDLEERMVKGSETPAWSKAEKGENWIKDLMDNMDDILDEEEKSQLMQACGRSCYNRAFGVASRGKATPAEADVFLKRLEGGGYKVTRGNNKTTVIFNWGRDHQNPWGLIMSDGYCMCPLVEKDSVKLSPTFCKCSTGYVKEMFERSTGRTANVELLDSLKMGGKDCIFKIEMTE